MLKVLLVVVFFFTGWRLRVILLCVLGFILWFTHWKPSFDEKRFELYFGLPGCGKTTALTYMYLLFRKRSLDIFTNVKLAGAYKVHRSDFGKYDLHVNHEKSVVLYDEASCGYFKRNFAAFSNEENTFHSEHRHHHVMECFFCQTWDGIDLRLRELNSHLFYVSSKDYPIIGKVIFIRRIAKAFNISAEGDPKDAYQFLKFSTRWFLARPVFKWFNTYELSQPLPCKAWKEYPSELSQEKNPAEPALEKRERGNPFPRIRKLFVRVRQRK